MQQMLTETEKLEIIEHEWAKARAKNPEVIMRVHVRFQLDAGYEVLAYTVALLR